MGNDLEVVLQPADTVVCDPLSTQPWNSLIQSTATLFDCETEKLGLYKTQRLPLGKKKEEKKQLRICQQSAGGIATIAPPLAAF